MKRQQLYFPKKFVFLLVKPDGMRYIDDIKYILKQKGIITQREIVFNNWPELARRMYKFCLQKKDPEFRANFEIHLWLQLHLFGSEGVIFTLKPPYHTLTKSVRYIRSVRDEIRTELFRKGDNRIIFLINTAYFENINKSFGFFGKIDICQQNRCLHAFSNLPDGKWDLFFFKYVHSPDSVEELWFQSRVFESFFDQFDV